MPPNAITPIDNILAFNVKRYAHNSFKNSYLRKPNILRKHLNALTYSS